MNRNRNKKVEIGEIWSTKEELCLPGGEVLEKVESPKDVVILLDDRDVYRGYKYIRVAPISSETRKASDWDLILEGAENPLGEEEIMIELWNSQPMMKMNLDQRLGKFSDEIIERLDRINQKLWGQEINIEGIKTGTSITASNDTRLEFQEREFEKTLYLRGPVNYLFELWEQEAEEEEFLKELSAAVASALVIALMRIWWQTRQRRIFRSAEAETSESVPVTVLEESGERRTVHFKVAEQLTIDKDGEISAILEAPGEEHFEGSTLSIRLNNRELGKGTLTRHGIAMIGGTMSEEMLEQICSILENQKETLPIQLPLDEFEIILK